MTKPPYNPNGKKAESNNPQTWCHFLTVKAAANQFDGVGFVLTQERGIVGVDFDDCRCPAFDGVTTWANSLDTVLPEIADHIRKLNGYTEISPSGKGIRVILKGNLPVNGRKKGDFEVYQHGRFVTVTGHTLDGFPRTIEPRQMEVDDFYKAVFGTPEEPPKQEKKPRKDDSPFNWTDLREKAFRSVNGQEIERLWNGDFSAHPSQSEGDLCLCSHLAFWLAGDAAAIDSAFRQSGLMRKKWDEKHHSDGSTYGEGTIKKAIEGCKTFYGEDRQSQEETAKAPPEEWPDPIPFNDYSLLPLFPVETIPGVCGEMVAAVAKSCQVDPGLPGLMMMAALSTAIGARVRICLNSHTEQGNLYLLSVLGSGNRKSGAVSLIAAPVYVYQRAKQESMSPIIREAENRKRVLEKCLEKMEKEAANTDDRIERERVICDCNELREEIEKNPVPLKPVFLLDDVTPERLGGIMADNDERAAILSAEGGFFKLIGGLYNKGQSNLDLILKSHTGDPWASDRVGKESKSMSAPALTLGLAVQPDVLEEIGRNSEFRGRGLSARFLYAWCQSHAGYRELQASPVSMSVKDAYHRLILSLMAVEGRHDLTLAPEAQTIWNGFYADVESLFRPGAELEHLVDWGSKLPGAVARISGLLHFGEHGPEGIGKSISDDSVSNACHLGAYYLEHAKASFGIMKEDARLNVARKILAYIKRCRPERIKGADLFSHTNLQSMDAIQPGIIILIERGYIREVGKVDYGRKIGRPESPSYEVNPKVFSNEVISKV